MQQFLELCSQPGGFWLPVLILCLMFFLTLVAIVAVVEWRKLRQAELLVALAEDMLQRGAPAADILAALAACRGDGSLPPEAAQPASKQTTLPEAALVA